MRFVKMHGLGNDYVYVNGFEETVSDPASLAPRIADRHFGVGGDGLILLLPPTAPGADVRMRMFNADGSEGEMCGNGIRCLCKLAHDHGVTSAAPMRVETGAGVLSLDYTLDGDGRVATVAVEMGEPILAPSAIPVRLPGGGDDAPVVEHPLSGLVDMTAAGHAGWRSRAGLEERMTAVSMGNPHAVLFCRDADAVPLAEVGPILEEAAIFPERVNAHFVAVHGPEEATVRTWERGSGATLACGTGAAAVCVAGVLANRTGRRLLAHLPGGDLSLEWRESDNQVIMEGPAAEVFTGVLLDGF